MSINVVDRRVQRTRYLLREALVGLIVEKGYDAISVQDIVSHARIGRSTFYNHFKDKDELLRAGMEDLRLELREHCDRSPRPPGTPALRFVRGIIDHAQDQRFLLRAMLGRRSGAAVQTSFRQMLCDLTRDEILEITGLQLTPSLDAAAHCLGGALLELLRWWVETRNPLAPDDVEELIHRLTMPALAALLGSKSLKSSAINC
jgi:AcrR family transcriptional regulator